MRYEYRFDKVGIRKSAQAYEERVRSAALDGWRLIQILVEQPAAVAGGYVLVLERPAEA